MSGKAVRSELARLVVDGSQVDSAPDKLLAQALEPYVAFTKDEGSLIVREPFLNLAANLRALCVLLAAEAQSRPGLGGKGIGRKSADVAAKAHLSPKGCREALSRWKRKGLVERLEGGLYAVPQWRLKTACDLLVQAQNRQEGLAQ